MKTPEQIASDKAAAGKAINAARGSRMQHLLALGTGVFVAWALSGLMSDSASAITALTTYVLAYPLYVYIGRRSRRM